MGDTIGRLTYELAYRIISRATRSGIDIFEASDISTFEEEETGTFMIDFTDGGTGTGKTAQVTVELR